MTHSDYAFFVAVIVFIIAFLAAAWEKSLYAVLIAAGLTAVSLGLLLVS